MPDRHRAQRQRRYFYTSTDNLCSNVRELPLYGGTGAADVCSNGITDHGTTASFSIDILKYLAGQKALKFFLNILIKKTF